MSSGRVGDAQSVTTATARMIGRNLYQRIGTRPPIDLNALARELGAVDVLYRTRVRHGYTEWSDRGPSIQIALSNTDGRRRSTLAHECGHLMFDPLFEPPAFRVAARQNQLRQREISEAILGDLTGEVASLVECVDLELLCDKLALELLIPAPLARTLAKEVGCLADLREHAKALRVSLAMLLIRINEFGGRRRSMLHVVRGEAGDWLVTRAIAVPPEWRGRVTVDGLRATRRVDSHDSTLTLHARDRSATVNSDVCVISRNRAIVLLEMSQFSRPGFDGET